MQAASPVIPNLPARLARVCSRAATAPVMCVAGLGLSSSASAWLHTAANLSVHKQQLPAWLRLHDAKCQQSKEHKSGFIFISSSTVPRYFNALQVLIKDLATRNLSVSELGLTAAWVFLASMQ